MKFKQQNQKSDRSFDILAETTGLVRQDPLLVYTVHVPLG